MKKVLEKSQKLEKRGEKFQCQKMERGPFWVLYFKLEAFGCLTDVFMKSSEKFRDTQRVPFMLDKTRKPLFHQLGTKNILKIILRIFLPENVTVPKKIERGVPLVSFRSVLGLSSEEKTRRERLKSALYLRLKIFLKKNSKFLNLFFVRKLSHNAEKCKRGDPLGFINIHSFAKFQTRRGDPLGTSGFGFLEKLKNERGTLRTKFALALGGFRKKWTDQCEVCGLKKKVTAIVGHFFLKRKKRRLERKKKVIVRVGHFLLHKKRRLKTNNKNLF